VLAFVQIWWKHNCEGTPETGELEALVTGWIEKAPVPAQKKESQADKLALEKVGTFWSTEDDDTWSIVAAWLINALRPAYSQPSLVVTGEQESAKTTLCRVLRSIGDSNIAEMRSAPRELHDLFISARNAWIITIDNLAGMRDWLSDGFCRLSTGGGMSTRRRYTYDEEELFDAIRPVILNGTGASCHVRT